MRLKSLDDHLAAHLAGKRLLTVAQATKETDRHPTPKPITGVRRMLIRWRLRRQYRAELRAAGL